MSKHDFKKWSTSFSATVLRLITILWSIFMAYSAVIITITVFRTGALYEIGTFITEVNKTFIAAVVSILITRVVGNVFENNNGGIFGESITKEDKENEEEV